MADFRLAVDEANLATELRFLRIGGTVRRNPHMRAFWAATIAWFVSFVGWFALAPVSLEVASSLGLCENQLFPPAEFPTRPAYLTYAEVKTQRAYCRYGANDPVEPTDCNAAPADSTAAEDDRYDPSVLSGCVCSGGTLCASVLADAGVAGLASTIFLRAGMGVLLEKFGPVNVQAGLLVFTAVWVAAGSAITSAWNFILVRFMVGAAGALFIATQFWVSLMFSHNIVGTANATAAGWGDLGGGVVHVFMTVVLFEPLKAMGLSADMAWRSSMFVPAALLIVAAASVKLLCWDTPTARRYSSKAEGTTSGPTIWAYAEVLRDRKVVVMMLQYSACVGVELSMQNLLGKHCRTYFQMAAGDAAVMTSAFGMVNVFARSLGGIFSDALYVRFGVRGRLWAQCSVLLVEAVLLFGFGLIDNRQPWWVALVVMVLLSTFVQMAEGTSFGIVPFMGRRHLALVAALVGAGGNLGAVFAGVAFYKPIRDPLTPFKLHAGYVLVCALLTPLYYWPEHGGLFWRPAEVGDGAPAAGKMDAEEASESTEEATEAAEEFCEESTEDVDEADLRNGVVEASAAAAATE